MLGRGTDRPVQVQLFGGPVTGPAAQAFQGHFDVAGAQLNRVIQVLELALVPDFDRALVAAFFLADTHAFGVVAISAKRRRACGPDPFAAALMATFLFFQPLFQRLHQLVKTTQRVNLGHFFGAEMLFRHFSQPFFGHINRVQHILHADLFQARKGRGKGAVEFVEIAFVFDHYGACQVVECVDIIGDQTRSHAFEKAQILAQADRHATVPEVFKEWQKHGLYRQTIHNDGDKQADDRKHQRIDRRILQNIQ